MNFQRLANSIIFIFFLLCPLSGVAQESELEQEQDATESIEKFKPLKRFRLKIDLSNQDLEQLKRDGRLRLRIPEFYENSVAAILLQHVDTYMTEKVRVSGEPKVVDDASQIRMDELMLERLQYQPIEFRVFEKNFSTVEICYIAEPQARVFVANEDDGLTREAYQIQIRNRLNLHAKISQLEKLKLNTDYGAYTINWSDVQQIQFGEFGTASAKLFLKDGSAVSGHLEIETLDIKTRWGKITIPANDLNSISR